MRATRSDPLEGEISIRHNTQISIEQPVCHFQFMPFTKRLLGRPGWFQKQADHCSNRGEDDIIFPRKRTDWFLYNVKPDVPLQLCPNNCGDCLIDGTPFHKKIISWRADMNKDQEIMRDPVEKGRIPMKI